MKSRSTFAQVLAALAVFFIGIPLAMGLVVGIIGVIQSENASSHLTASTRYWDNSRYLNERKCVVPRTSDLAPCDGWETGQMWATRTGQPSDIRVCAMGTHESDWKGTKVCRSDYGWTKMDQPGTGNTVPRLPTRAERIAARSYCDSLGEVKQFSTVCLPSWATTKVLDPMAAMR